MDELSQKMKQSAATGMKCRWPFWCTSGLDVSITFMSVCWWRKMLMGLNPASEELSHAAVFVWRPQTGDGDGGMFPQGRPRSAAPLLHMHVQAHVYLGTMTACPLQILQNLGWIHADFFFKTVKGCLFFLQRQGSWTFLRLCLDWINLVVCWVVLFNICGLYHSVTVWLWQSKCVYFNRSLTSCFVLTSFICGHGTAGENPANAFPTWSTLSWRVDGKLPTQHRKKTWPLFYKLG